LVLQQEFGLDIGDLHDTNWSESEAVLAIAGMLSFTISDVRLQYRRGRPRQPCWQQPGK
jgi:hypothetical protein